MKQFKCIKQLILHSGNYVQLSSGLFHILITNCMSHPRVCNVTEQVFWRFWEPEPNWPSNKATVSPFIKIVILLDIIIHKYLNYN